MRWFRKDDNYWGNETSLCSENTNSPDENRLMKPKSTLGKSIALCLSGAIIGGLISASAVLAVNKKDAASLAVAQQSAKVTQIDYKNTSTYPVVEIAKNVGPAVVMISNFQTVASPFMFGGSGFSGGSAGDLTEVGTGSGFIIDAAKGYIVTNNHVIAGAKKISVSLTDGRTVDATLVGADSRTDLAVIKIKDVSNLTAVTLGDSTILQVGEPVVAIGNPGGQEFAGSVTAGVVSATDRLLELEGESSFSLIQTDAAINPGNSGGPLVNYLGEVIGINSAKFQETGFEGMGFAIPISDALPTIRQLIDKGYATHAGLNVHIASQYTKELAKQKGWPAGAYISKVIKGGAADKAGLKQGDIITKINDRTISRYAELTHELFKYKVGDKVKITYYRDGATRETTAQLVEIKGN